MMTGAEFIMVCLVIYRSAIPPHVPDFSHKVDLNKYLKVVLEPLPYTEAWSHRGLQSPSIAFFILRWHSFKRSGRLCSLSQLRADFMSYYLRQISNLESLVLWAHKQVLGCCRYSKFINDFEWVYLVFQVDCSLMFQLTRLLARMNRCWRSNL